MSHSFWTIFLTIFLAEIGDKTQLSTLLYASDRSHSPWMVFAASAAALVLAAAMGTGAGAILSRYLNPVWLRYLAGTAFVIIGILTIVRAD